MKTMAVGPEDLGVGVAEVARPRHCAGLGVAYADAVRKVTERGEREVSWREAIRSAMFCEYTAASQSVRR